VTLSPKQRAHLRSLAHHLKANFHVGKEGVTDAAVDALTLAFNTRELLKVKVSEAAPVSARDAGDALAERIDGAHHVQTIGRTVILYRPAENPEIELPRG
jgi:RNA-binding protein